MKTKKIILIRILISFIVMIYADFTVFSQGNVDTTKKRVVLTFPAYYIDYIWQSGDSIQVKGFFNDSVIVSGKAACTFTEFLPIYLEGDTTANLLNLELKFRFYDNIRGCFTDLTTFTIDSSSTSDAIYILNFDANSYSAFYQMENVCNTYADTLTLQTNLPEYSYQTIAPLGLSIDSTGTINPSNSLSGIYYIDISTNYCLQYSLDSSLLISIQSPVALNLPDTLRICSGLPYNSTVYGNYAFYEPGNTTTEYDSLDAISSSGYYVVKNLSSLNCSSTDTAYLDIIKPEDITFNQIENCENVTVNIDKSLNTGITTNWLDGNTSENIEVTGSEYIKVQVIDEYGCISYDSAFVSFNPMQVESVNYVKEEEDCWKDGSISISELNVLNYIGDLRYRAINTINNIQVDNLSAVPGGKYRLQVIDSRGCVKEYQNEITIIQKCLEDYPVFSPNTDGIEDEYFIPYEGTVKIYDRDGTLIKELTTPAYWDGSDKNNNPVPMGNYVILTDSDRAVNITVIR